MAMMVRAKGPEAVFEELGDGVEAAFQELGQEEEGHPDEGDGGEPLVAGDGHADPVGGLPGHADELLGEMLAAMREKPTSHQVRRRARRGSSCRRLSRSPRRFCCPDRFRGR